MPQTLYGVEDMNASMYTVTAITALVGWIAVALMENLIHALASYLKAHASIGDTWVQDSIKQSTVMVW